MALLVGQLIAQLDLDTTPYQAKAARMTGEGKKLVKQLSGDKVVLDGDARPLEQANDKARKSTSDTAKQIDSAFASAWKSVAADLQRIEKEAWESGDGMDKAFTSSTDHIKAVLRDLRAEAGKTGAGLDSEIGEALRRLQAETRQLGEAGKQGGEELVSGFSEALGSVGGGGMVGELLSSFTSGKNAFLGAGLTLGALLVQGIQQRWAELKVGALIAAQTGAAASEIGRLGSMAGDLYAQGFGDSIEEAGEAIAAVVNVLIPADAMDESIELAASKVQTLGTVMGEEFSNISRAARTMLFNGMATNVSAALDIIAQANENGLNIAGDLLDTLSEYSSQFSRIGLEGPEALGLLQQAMESGARDTDFAADAIKEFVLRSQDLSVSARGFQTLGFNAEEMSNRIAAGGETARDALRDVLNGLQTMEPGLERNTAAVDLFGTKAEDLGDSLYSMDLDNAAQEFGDFAGSVEEATQKLAEGQSVMDKVQRGLSVIVDGVGDALGVNERLTGPLAEYQKHALEFRQAVQMALAGDMSGLEALRDMYPQVSDQIDVMIDEMGGATGASNSLTGSYEEQIKALGDLIAEEEERAGKVLDLSEAQIGYNQDIADATEAMKEFHDKGILPTKDGFDLATEAGRSMNSSLNDVAKGALDVMDAMEKQGATTQEVHGFVVGARAQFVKMADSMGLSEGAANALADKLGLIPGNYKATVQVTGVELARQRAQSLIDLIRGMPSTKLIDLRVNTTGMPGGHFFAGQAVGSIAEFYADGGLRPLQGNAAGVIQSFSRTGVQRVIGDNPRFDEAYIPLDRSSARSQAILDEAIKRMRPEWMRGNGSASGGGASTAGGYGGEKREYHFHNYGPDPKAVAREVREQMRAEDALRGY